MPDPLHSPLLPLLTSPKGQLLPPGLGQASTAAVEMALPSKEGGHIPSAGELSPGRGKGKQRDGEEEHSGCTAGWKKGRESSVP